MSVNFLTTEVMGQAHAKSGAAQSQEERLREAQRSLEQLSTDMKATGSSATRTFLALPRDAQALFKEDHAALMAARARVSELRQRRTRMRGVVMQGMIDNVDTALGNFDKVLAHYMKTTTLAFKVMPVLSASMDAYFKIVGRRLKALDEVAGAFRKNMESVASPLGDTDGVTKEVAGVLRNAMDSAKKRDSSQQELEKVQGDYVKKLSTWSSAATGNLAVQRTPSAQRAPAPSAAVQRAPSVAPRPSSAQQAPSPW